jgi:hypothetical protein
VQGASGGGAAASTQRATNEAHPAAVSRRKLLSGITVEGGAQRGGSASGNAWFVWLHATLLVHDGVANRTKVKTQ